MPSIELFDGTTNPDDHLDVYKVQMYVQDVDDATCCLYFSVSLKGIAQKWFNGLPNGSVTASFNEQSRSMLTLSLAKGRKRPVSTWPNSTAAWGGPERICTKV